MGSCRHCLSVTLRVVCYTRCYPADRRRCPLRTPALLVLMLLALAIVRLRTTTPRRPQAAWSPALVFTPTGRSPLPRPSLHLCRSPPQPRPPIRKAPLSNRRQDDTQRHNRNPRSQTSPETDREALVALYNATGGPNWDSSGNWLRDVPIGEWFGVTTDDNGHVTELNLRDNPLSGETPPELGNLATWKC